MCPCVQQPPCGHVTRCWQANPATSGSVRCCCVTCNPRESRKSSKVALQLNMQGRLPHICEGCQRWPHTDIATGMKMPDILCDRPALGLDTNHNLKIWLWDCHDHSIHMRRSDPVVSPCHYSASFRVSLKTVWPSGLRRWLKAPVCKGVGSNPTAVICCCTSDNNIINPYGITPCAAKFPFTVPWVPRIMRLSAGGLCDE